MNNNRSDQKNSLIVAGSYTIKSLEYLHFTFKVIPWIVSLIYSLLVHNIWLSLSTSLIFGILNQYALTTILLRTKIQKNIINEKKNLSQEELNTLIFNVKIWSSCISVTLSMLYCWVIYEYGVCFVHLLSSMF